MANATRTQKQTTASVKPSKAQKQAALRGAEIPKGAAKKTAAPKKEAAPKAEGASKQPRRLSIEELASLRKEIAAANKAGKTEVLPVAEVARIAASYGILKRTLRKIEASADYLAPKAPKAVAEAPAKKAATKAAPTKKASSKKAATETATEADLIAH